MAKKQKQLKKIAKGSKEAQLKGKQLLKQQQKSIAKAKQKEKLKKQTIRIGKAKATEKNLKRPRRALQVDMRATSKRTIKPKSLKDIKKWEKNPQRYDLEGVDTKKKGYRQNIKRFDGKDFNRKGDYLTKQFATDEGKLYKKTHYYRVKKERNLIRKSEQFGGKTHTNYSLFLSKKKAKPKIKYKPKKYIKTHQPKPKPKAKPKIAPKIKKTTQKKLK
jgi:hypothetical protein